MEPIAPPEPTQAVRRKTEEQVQVFRVRFWWMTLYLSPLYTGMLVVMISDTGAPWYGTLTAGVTAAVLVAATYYLLSPVRLCPSGVQATTFWGFKIRLNWDDITTVRSARWFFGLPYLRVFSSHAPVMWLSLFVGHRDILEGGIIEHAPESNPLRVYLENRRRKPR